ncbi:MAG: response regulator transcription factor, partial [Elusimicrobiota bacterium]|nr:response regulator transcription factor [Elusimicrobiota bacterium]
MKKIIRVIIVDDHKILREALVNLLLAEKKIKVIAETNTGLSAIRLAGRYKPDMILMDIKLPKLNGIEATKRILGKFKKSSKKPKIVILSMYDDEAHIMESIRAGASGYIVKSCSGDEIIEAIERVSKG